MTKKIAFFHFPKTAGSFIGFYIREFLQDHFLLVGHPAFMDVKDQVKGLINISFVRNPFDWYVSRYFYYVRPDWKTEGGLLKNCDNGLSGPGFSAKFPTFESHMKWGFNNVTNFSMTSCYNKMFFDNNRIMQMHHIGKTENLDSDFNTILTSCKINIPDISLSEYYKKYKHDQLHTNHSYHGPYQNYYTDELIQLVLKNDKEIIDKFNYSFKK
jgi:hypothetical protein